MSRQLLETSTSVGANVDSAIGGEMKGVLYLKCLLPIRNYLETNRWLILIKDFKIVFELNSDILYLLKQSEKLLQVIVSLFYLKIS